MRASLPGRVEMTIVLPLDVVASKLKRIEEELRHLSIQAMSIDQESASEDLKDLIEARLERIRDTICAISSCLSDLSTDMQCADDLSVTPSDDAHGIERYFREDPTDAPFERENSERAYRKPQPDRDD
jgi:hypothetical protein